MSDEINSEVVEQIRASAKLRGPIEKVVLNAQGKLVDGHQRKAADPNWPEEVNPKLVTEEDSVLFDIDKNWHRTNKSENWKRSRIEKLARLGNSVQDIVGKTGLKEWVVYNCYPADLKNQVKAEAGRIGGPAASVVRVTTQLVEKKLREAEEEALSSNVECSNCRLGHRSDQVIYIDGKPYCPRCAPDASIAYKKEQKRLEDAVKKEKPVSPKSLDAAEQKLARMHPQKSAFEERVVNRFRQILGEMGFGLETDREFCVVPTVPDAYVPGLNGLAYIDGPVHAPKREDKDERLRELLKKHHDELNIQGFRYRADSKVEEERVLKEMRKWAEGLKAESEKWRK